MSMPGNSTPVALGSYELMKDGFMKYHQDHLNNVLHLFTTPIAIFATFCLINRLTKTRNVSPALCVVYTIALAFFVPPAMVMYCTVAMVGMAYLSQAWDCSPFMSVPLIVLGYVGQDAAHWYTGEKTFQSTYEQEAGALGMICTHAFYLLPLVLESAGEILAPIRDAGSTGMLGLSAVPVLLLCLHHSLRGEGGFFPWDHHPARVLHTKLRTKSDLKDLAEIRKFSREASPSQTTSSHWWYEKAYDKAHSLSTPARDAFKRIAEGEQMMGMFHKHFNPAYYQTDCVFGMNELYATGPEISNSDSDTVFYTKHVDGPYGMIPFASLYRCIMACDTNTQVSTIFPMTGQYITAADGDCVGFDFHKEVHFIQSDYSQRNKDHRVVLKLHYVVYPKWAASVGQLLHYLSVKYNESFRELFIFTIQPKTLFARFSAFNVVFWTIVVEKVWTHCGLANPCYVALLAACAMACGNWMIFLIGTSFVHSLRVLATCYGRSNVDFGVYKRDVIFFKAMAAIQLAYLYVTAEQQAGQQSLSLGLIAAGLAQSVVAAQLVGAHHVFSAELLGVEAPKAVFLGGKGEKEDGKKAGKMTELLRMLVVAGECVALYGVHMVLKDSLPYLAPAQICLNIAILVQDAFKLTKKRNAVPMQPAMVMHAKAS